VALFSLCVHKSRLGTKELSWNYPQYITSTRNIKEYVDKYVPNILFLKPGLFPPPLSLACPIHRSYPLGIP